MGNNIMAVTMGDPAGIGPEIVLKAFSENNFSKAGRLVVIGSLEVLKKTKEQNGINVELIKISDIEEAKTLSADSRDSIKVLDLDNIKFSDYRIGQIQKNCGRAAAEYIYRGIELARRGELQALITGPIHKEALKLAGIKEAGHTEILASEFNVQNYAMLLAEKSFRISHVSTHVSLKEACELVKEDRVFQVIKLTDEFLGDLNLDKKKIAVAGLNPHAGEHGLFGQEEKQEIKPALNRAVEQNINVEGPFPPDTIFARARAGEFQAVVAMYHDQGHIPMKTVGFQFDAKKDSWLAVSGVNVTLGLPVIRTSVDHGVAFDIAGKNRARPDSLKEAVMLAGELV